MRLLLTFLFLVISNTSIALCNSGVDENFGIFLAKFSDEKKFSVNRTLYPTYTLRHEYGVENGKEVHSTVKTIITKDDDSATPTIAEILRINSMETKVKSTNSTNAVVNVYKPDTDWLLSYHFKLRGSCWYLHHIEDHSL